MICAWKSLPRGNSGGIGYGCTGRAISARFSNPGGICRCRRISSARIPKDDRGTYQTVYARDDKAGSVAAPTAGLHFTPELRAQMASAGVEWAEVTLHVGYGTFSPVRCEDIREHVMHEEFVEVPQATVDAIGKAKAEGRPVIAVGTTSARTLEGVAGAAWR